MSSHKAKILFEIRRFKDFLKIFRRNKRGMLGMAIIISFAVIAVGASIFSPYDPTTTYIYPKIAYRFSKPVWYKYLFPGERISENVNPIPDPYFKTATAIEKLEFDTTLTSIHPEFVSNEGYSGGSGAGCCAIVFARAADTNPYGEVKVHLTKLFNYPYSSPPQQFQGQAAILVDNPQNFSVNVNLVLEKVGSERRIVWIDEDFRSAIGGWRVPSPIIDSDAYSTRKWLNDTHGREWFENPAATMFSEPADYEYGIEITFNDTYANENVEVTIYIDDLFLKVFGNSFGVLGTDMYGRDIFTQLIYGARISLLVGSLSALFSTIVGLAVGLTAGYVGGYIDNILMRFTDLLLVIPDTPLYIVLMYVLTPSIWTLILLITLIGWTGFARIVRSQALSLKERPFVEATKAIGAGKFHVIVRHILPNVMSLVYVSLATAVPSAIIAEAWLSWLGLYDPTTMTWGRMLHDVQEQSEGIFMWWWVVPPGLCIAAISLSFILIGYALDEILNPKLRERR